MKKVSCLAATRLPTFLLLPNEQTSVQSTCASISQVENDVVPSVSSPPNEACSKPNEDQILTLHPAPPASYPVIHILFFFGFFSDAFCCAVALGHDYLIQG